MADLGRAPVRQPGVLQGRLGSPVGEAVSDRTVEPAPADVRPEDQEADAHQHLLRDAPPLVCRGCQQHALDQRRWTGGGLAEHEAVRGDRRRGEGPGLDGPDHRHQRQRQARCVRRAERAPRPGQGQALQRRLLLGAAGARRLDLGLGARLPGRRRAPRAREQSAGDDARGGVRAAVQGRRPEEAGLLAARHGRRSQWRRLGRRSRAATWRASTAASARRR